MQDNFHDLIFMIFEITFLLISFLTHVETFTLILLTARCSITLKKTEKHFFIKVPKYKQYSPILASNFEQKGQENTTSYNLQY